MPHQRQGAAVLFCLGWKAPEFSLKKAHGLSCGCHWAAPSSNRQTGLVDLAVVRSGLTPAFLNRVTRTCYPKIISYGP